MSTSTAAYSDKIDKAEVARNWAKSSLETLKELAPLVQNVPWLGVAAGIFVNALELLEVSLLVRFVIQLI